MLFVHILGATVSVEMKLAFVTVCWLLAKNLAEIKY